MLKERKRIYCGKKNLPKNLVAQWLEFVVCMNTFWDSEFKPCFLSQLVLFFALPKFLAMINFWKYFTFKSILTCCDPPTTGWIYNRQ